MSNLICTRASIPSFMIALLLFILAWYSPEAEAGVRIKDIARIQGDAEMDLFGYGLVIGLDGTGDGKGTQFTMQSLANMMQRMGMTVDPEKLKVKNVAAVIVTGRLSSTHKAGDRVDVTVSSIGDASSLQGGTLLMTQMSMSDGEVYATAQGPVSIGGFNVQVEDGNKIINNYTLVGRVPNGGIVTRPIIKQSNLSELVLSLQMPDYATASRMAETIMADLPFQRGDSVIAMVNGMGGTPLIELYLVYNELDQICRRKGLTLARRLVGNYITSLEMAGCSITLLKADDELLSLWDAPVLTAGLRWGM